MFPWVIFVLLIVWCMFPMVLVLKGGAEEPWEIFLIVRCADTSIGPWEIDVLQ